MGPTQFAKRALIALSASLMLAACGDIESTGGDYAYAPDHNGSPNYNNSQSYADAGTSEQADPDYQEGENYEEWEENDFVDTATENTSTFSIDVDNASYTLMRRDIRNGYLPAAEGVRPEEYINFFSYDYVQPAGEDPFSINMEIAPSKFGAEDHKLLRIGLQGEEIPVEDLKPTNLVFLIDVSGSMQSSHKLPMVKESLYTLLDHLRPSDSVGIVVYAGADGVVLEPTEVQNRAQIQSAIENLSAGGSTNGEAGIVSAYKMAEQAKIEGGNNRVIILTDGDFNVGKTGDDLVQLVRDYRDKHISLTCVGYGMGNYNDATMEWLARDGNGNYFYVDSEQEAQRIFGDNLPSTLEVIASDVKIQVEFDQTSVARYRLVGYENRVMANEDFDDDTKDAGEIGPGHTVTALYEIELSPDAAASTNNLATVRMRYKPQYGDESKLLQRGIKMSQVKDTFEGASDSFRFAAAVAEYAEILRESKHSEGARYDDVLSIAQGANPGADPQKTEFVDLVGMAKTIASN
ncbi:VWA domain-containing protein [Persicimonas caeni]|uniref:VWA domain-containing protein n=1 Tax=Persicimonas caeni TaxID=2292766 RepID=A0A4Y6PT84_PERCE|nr:von Willebrand factor type A domain-containing protein [Persicimonas caeni]QDG51532.1 VWA domain-containing protein [Persicimonas caeni]QED32753.1 VWA domain-containing protein [Persicimonas caeni]